MKQKESNLSFKNIFQRETKLATYIIVCCTILVLGISYAVFFQVNQNSNNQVVETGDLTFTYQDGNQITSNGKSFCFEPMSGEEAGLYFNDCSYQFSVQNAGSLMGSYSLTLTSNAGNTASSDQIKVLLKRQNANGILEIVEGYPKKLSEIANGILLKDEKIEKGASIVYSIQMYIDESAISDGSVNTGSALTIDYVINGSATVHEEQNIHTDPPLYAADQIKALATSNPDQLVYDGTSDNNLRYIGANPNNYVTFNNELWRIIGVMNNIDNGSGTKESRLKIIRNEFYSTGMAWDTGNVNDWTTASLQEELNATYLNSITSPYQEMIGNAVWNLGGSSTFDDDTARMFYERERGTEVYIGPTTWTGKIGLMYPSDYGYATNGGSTTDRNACLAKELYNWDSLGDCYNNDWLYSSYDQWTLTLSFDDSNLVFLVSSSGFVGSGSASRTDTAVSPALYLSSNVRISGGTGSSSDPYQLSL